MVKKIIYIVLAAIMVGIVITVIVFQSADSGLEPGVGHMKFRCPDGMIVGPGMPSDQTIEEYCAERGFVVYDAGVEVRSARKVYRVGETVEIAIVNNFEIDQLIHSPFYVVEKYTRDGEWENIRRVICPCGAMCKMSGSFQLAVKSHKSYEWDQQETWCEGEPRVLSDSMSEQVSFGIYRVKAEISEVDDPYTRSIIYSSSFIIH